MSNMFLLVKILCFAKKGISLGNVVSKKAFEMNFSNAFFNKQLENNLKVTTINNSGFIDYSKIFNLSDYALHCMQPQIQVLPK